MAIAFTPTERRILEVLKDGEPHPPRDLQRAIDPQQPAMVASGALRVHLTRIRRKIKREGMDIVAQFLKRKVYYRWIRTLPHTGAQGNP